MVIGSRLFRFPRDLTTTDDDGGGFQAAVLRRGGVSAIRCLAARRNPDIEKRVQAALCVAVPPLQKIELWRDVRGTPHERGKYQHWRPQGAWQTEEQFSDGTLRLLGLL